MRTIKAFLAPGIGLLGVAMFAAPAMASDSTGGFALHGVGAQTCQMMLQELQPAVPAAAITPASVTQASATPASVTSASVTPGAVTPGAVTPAAVPPVSAPVAASSSGASPSASSVVSPTATTSAAIKSTPADAASGPKGEISSAVTAPAASPPTAPSALGMRPILTSWIMGYLTASDRLVKDTFDQTPVMAPEALTTMIIGVCNRYPAARVESVANNVLNQLAAARVLHESPVVEARSGDRVVLIRQATLAAMQNNLVKARLLKEPADGTFGSATSAALMAFQKSQNLPATGLPDASTVVRLLIEMPAKVPAKPVRNRK
jgi:peptidoglycan hydrolase-like protein with peptidoglycan-binding domain